MSYEFKDGDKEVREFKPQLPFGISKLKFQGAVIGETDDGRDYITVGVQDESGVEDEVLLWFTGGASNVSFNTIRDIIVHNCKEENKQQARDFVDNVKNTEELANFMEEVLGDTGELWFTKYYDAKRTYQGKDGKTYRSINKNIMGYEPKLKPDLMPKPKADSEELDKDNVKEFFSDMGPVGDTKVPEDVNIGERAGAIPRKW